MVLGWSRPLQAYRRALDTATRVLLVGAGGVGQAIAVALALAGVGSLAITNRTQAKADDLADRVRGAAPACKWRPEPSLIRPVSILSSMRPPWGQNGQGPLPLDVSRVSAPALGGGRSGGTRIHAAPASGAGAGSRDRAWQRDADAADRDGRGLSRHDRLTQAQGASASVVGVVPGASWGVPTAVPGPCRTTACRRRQTASARTSLPAVRRA